MQKSRNLQLQQPLLDQQPLTSYDSHLASRSNYPTLEKKKHDPFEDEYRDIELTEVKTKPEDKKVEIKTNDLSDQLPFDPDYQRKIYIRTTIHTKCQQFKERLAVLAQKSNGEVFAEISQRIRWEEIEEALIALHIGKGQHMGYPDRQQEKEAIMTAFGKASQCDEGLFTLLNLITAVKGLINVFGDSTVLKTTFWTIISIIAVYGAFPDIYGINPAKQAKNNISPDFKFEIEDFRSIEQAKFYLHVLKLHEKIFETPMKPWKKNLSTLALGIGSMGGFYFLGQRYFSSYIEQASWPIVAATSTVASSALTLSTYKGFTLSALQMVSEPINWLSFGYTNGLGAIAQLIPIAELYRTQISLEWMGLKNPDNYSRWLKLTLGLAFWAVVYLSSLRHSKMKSYKKHFFTILWASLCASLAIENPTPWTLQLISTAWTLGFFIPVGVSYYEFLSRNASNFWGKHFWTKKNIIYQLFKISFWLGAENTLQLLSNCVRRSAAFSGIIADYLLLAYLVNDCPSWVMWPTLGITLLSSIFTRMAGLPILSTFQYTDPFGQPVTIPTINLLEFEIDGSPAMDQVKLPPSTKAEQALLSTLFGGFLGSGIGLLTCPQLNPLASFAVAAGSVAVFGGINYVGQDLSRRAEIARKIIDDAILIRTEDEKTAVATSDRLKTGGMKFAVSTVVSNATMRILSSAFLIAGFGLIFAKAGILDPFTTVWLAVLFLATAPAVNEGRVTLFAEALPTAIEWIKGSEDTLVAEREGYDLLLVSKHDPIKHQEIKGDAIILSNDNTARFTIGSKILMDETGDPLEVRDVGREGLEVCSSDEPTKYKITKNIKDVIVQEATSAALLPPMPPQSLGTKVSLTFNRAFYSIFGGNLPPAGQFYAENGPEIKDKKAHKKDLVVDMKQTFQKEEKYEPKKTNSTLDRSESLTTLPYRAETPGPMREIDLDQRLQLATKERDELLAQMRSGQTSRHQRDQLHALKVEIGIYTRDLITPRSFSTSTLASVGSPLVSVKRNQRSYQTLDSRSTRSLSPSHSNGATDQLFTV